jgi:hypothetical protein
MNIIMGKSVSVPHGRYIIMGGLVYVGRIKYLQLVKNLTDLQDPGLTYRTYIVGAPRLSIQCAISAVVQLTQAGWVTTSTFTINQQLWMLCIWIYGIIPTLKEINNCRINLDGLTKAYDGECRLLEPGVTHKT